MTGTLPCNLRNLLSHKSSKVVIWLSHVVRSLPAEASTLRGQAGWTATLSAGRFGRIGMRFLKERQYQSPSARSSLDEHDVQALKFLSFVISVAPPRAVYFGRSSCLPCRIYSDASHTEGVRTRLGWVFF